VTMLAQLGEKGVSIGARRTENEARSNGRNRCKEYVMFVSLYSFQRS